jgi:hypothetical protein
LASDETNDETNEKRNMKSGSQTRRTQARHGEPKTKTLGRKGRRRKRQPRCGNPRLGGWKRKPDTANSRPRLWKKADQEARHGEPKTLSEEKKRGDKGI